MQRCWVKQEENSTIGSCDRRQKKCRRGNRWAEKEPGGNKGCLMETKIGICFRENKCLSIDSTAFPARLSAEEKIRQVGHKLREDCEKCQAEDLDGNEG